jgi:hypothetical protein
VIKDGMAGRRFARSFSWSAATERLVNAIFVVIDEFRHGIRTPFRG